MPNVVNATITVAANQIAVPVGSAEMAAALNVLLEANTKSAYDAATPLITIQEAISGTEEGTRRISPSALAAAVAALVNAFAANLIGAAPAALDTIGELAAALGEDEHFSTTVLTALGLKMEAVVVTAEEYLALTPTQKADSKTLYVIYDAE
jgi:hypothetical protein